MIALLLQCQVHELRAVNSRIGAKRSLGCSCAIVNVVDARLVRFPLRAVLSVRTYLEILGQHTLLFAFATQSFNTAHMQSKSSFSPSILCLMPEFDGSWPRSTVRVECDMPYMREFRVQRLQQPGWT